MVAEAEIFTKQYKEAHDAFIEEKHEVQVQAEYQERLQARAERALLEFRGSAEDLEKERWEWQHAIALGTRLLIDKGLVITSTKAKLIELQNHAISEAKPGMGMATSFGAQSHRSKQHQDTASSNTDYYSLLGVPSNASHAEILKAAKKARIAARPDRCSGQNLSPKELEQVVDHSKAVGQAADVLTDTEKRVQYDARLRKERT